MFVSRTAADKHNKISLQAKTGAGFDRHMFALQAMAKKEILRTHLEGKVKASEVEDYVSKGGAGVVTTETIAADLPRIYQDPSWALLNHNILSTSTLSSPFIEGGGFGPVVPDGYGIGYGVRDDKLGFNVSSFMGDSAEMNDHLVVALRDIRDALEGRSISIDN